MKNVNKKTIQVAKQLGYIPICALDKKRPYVLKAIKGNNFYVIKTSHFEDEAQILKILDNIKMKKIITPKLYEFSNKYLVEDYLPSKPPSIDEFKRQISLVRKAFNKLHRVLNQASKLKQYTKDSQDKNFKLYEASADWLVARLKQWFSNNKSETKYRFGKQETNQSIKFFNKIQSQTIINFGAFSEQHFRIYKDKVGVFDFGKHIRFAPAEYDWAYAWWGYFLNEAIKHSFNFWVNFMEKMAGLSKNKKEFYGCIIERLAGIAKDLTHRKDVGNNMIKVEKTRILRDKILIFILQNK